MKIQSKSEASFIFISIILIVLAVMLNSRTLGLLLTPDGRIDSQIGKTIILVFQFSLAVFGIFIFLLRKKLNWTNILLSFIVVIVCLLLSEAALRISIRKDKPLISANAPKLSEIWSVDSITGLHAVYNNLKTGEMAMDKNRFNHSGYRDRDEFSSDYIDTSYFKILLLGDSYTMGATAWGEGESFAEVLEAEMDKTIPTIVWNTGIGGIGQVQEKYELEKHFPVLQPHLVILAFCTNDFADNHWPAGVHYVFEDGSWISRYSRIGDSVIVLSPQEAWLRAYPLSKSVFGSLRLLDLYISVKDRIINRYARNDAVDYERTQALLNDMAGYVLQNNSQFIVMLIPSLYDIKWGPDALYLTALDIFNRLKIPCFEPKPFLSVTDYLETPIDLHWNKYGHAKVGAELGKYVIEFIHSKNKFLR